MERSIFLLVLVAISARAHLSIRTLPNDLHAVHGLYVKPSVDGTTGDLYVAATEDNGVKTQWLTEQPINFMQYAQAGSPFTYSSSSTVQSLPHDETIVTNQKRAVLASPPMKYAYAFPGVSNDGRAFPYPYPYAIPSAPSTVPAPAEGSTELADKVAPVAPAAAVPSYPYYNPFSYYYAHLLSSLANAMNAVNEAGSTDKDAANATATAAVPQTAAPYWPYTYPWHYPYMMVDPSAWAQAQPGAVTTSTTSAPETTTPEATSNESE